MNEWAELNPWSEPRIRVDVDARYCDLYLRDSLPVLGLPAMRRFRLDNPQEISGLIANLTEALRDFERKRADAVISERMGK